MKKNMNRTFVFVLSVLFLLMNFMTVQAMDYKVCLDAKGKPYPANAPAISLCYVYSEEQGGYVFAGLIKAQVDAMKTPQPGQQDQIRQLQEILRQQQEQDQTGSQDDLVTLVQQYYQMQEQLTPTPAAGSDFQNWWEQYLQPVTEDTDVPQNYPVNPWDQSQQPGPEVTEESQGNQMVVPLVITEEPVEVVTEEPQGNLMVVPLVITEEPEEVVTEESQENQMVVPLVSTEEPVEVVTEESQGNLMVVPLVTTDEPVEVVTEESQGNLTVVPLVGTDEPEEVVTEESQGKLTVVPLVTTEEPEEVVTEESQGNLTVVPLVGTDEPEAVVTEESQENLTVVPLVGTEEPVEVVTEESQLKTEPTDPESENVLDLLENAVEEPADEFKPEVTFQQLIPDLQEFGEEEGSDAALAEEIYQKFIENYLSGEGDPESSLPVSMEEIYNYLVENGLIEGSSKKSKTKDMPHYLEYLLNYLKEHYYTKKDLIKIVQVSPNNEVVKTSPVSFKWNFEMKDPAYTVFNLSFLVKNLITGDISSSDVSVDSTQCGPNSCTYTVDTNAIGLKNAQVYWSVSGTYYGLGFPITVMSQNPGINFTLDTTKPKPGPIPTPDPHGKKPAMPRPQYPYESTASRSIGFYWQPSINAEYYKVSWMHEKGANGSLYLSNYDETCLLGLCTTYTTLPSTGRYAWVVTAYNAYGSTTSYKLSFDIIKNLPAPAPYRPNGTIFNHTFPSFEWQDIHNGANEYHLQVIGRYDNLIRLDRWYNVNDIYVGSGVCYVQSDVFLPAGSYLWRVQARNGSQTSSWSSWLEFYVECDYCNYNNVYYNNYANTVPTCSYPVGTITAATPDFQWRTLTGASYYMVTLFDSTGSVLFDTQVQNTNCTAEICSWSPNYKLPKNGNYSWSVSGYGANGSRWGSANGSFSLKAAEVLTPMVFLRPAQNGMLTDETPFIIWSDPGNSTALFHVEIFSADSVRLFSTDLNRDQAWCDGQTCSIEFKTIPDAQNYLITITPYSELNTQGEMISLVFSKGSIPLKLEMPKEGSVVSSRPMFRWKLADGLDLQYELVLTDSDNHVTSYSPLSCNAVGVTCDGDEAFFSPSDALRAGSYSASLFSAGRKYRSEEVHFKIQ